MTISSPSEGIYKEKGSKFFAYAFPAYTEEEIKGAMEEVKAAHPKARHYCYAYRLGMDKNNYRSNDDGEPSGTAGKPILGQIDSYGMTNVFVVVVRYFGGTKLGVPGLIHAYKESTKDAFGQAKIIEKTVEDIYNIAFDYSIMSDVMNAVKRCEVNVVNQLFDANPSLEIAIPQSEVGDTLLRLKARIAKVSLDHAEVMDDLEGLKMTYIRTN